MAVVVCRTILKNDSMKIENLMRPTTKDDWGIKELQNCILNIAKYIHDFCEENSIKYCIMGGTALGAVRHGGFIPWDDDIDIFMTPNEYTKFRNAFQEKGDKENFYLQELGESKGKVVYSKLRLNNSSFIEEAVAGYDIHHGVFVDIMIQHVFPDNWFAQKWMLLWQTYLELKSFANRTYKKRGLLFYYALKPLSWLPKRFLLNFALNQIWRYKDKTTDNFFHYYIGYPLKKSIYPRRLFSEYLLIAFETVKLRVPVGVKEYLIIMFGDYMKMPSIEQIRWAQHTHDWSPNKPFEKKGMGVYEAEKYLW